MSPDKAEKVARLLRELAELFQSEAPEPRKDYYIPPIPDWRLLLRRECQSGNYDLALPSPREMAVSRPNIRRPTGNHFPLRRHNGRGAMDEHALLGFIFGLFWGFVICIMVVTRR